jgi:hypothetical protein
MSYRAEPLLNPMNYLKEIPEELLYLIITYFRDYAKIDMISRIFKIYINYEEICKMYIPKAYPLIKNELSKYTEPPNWYLIYMARIDLSVDKVNFKSTYLLKLDYGNSHGQNYILLYNLYTEYIDTFKYIDKIPNHKDKFYYLVDYMHMKKKKITQNNLFDELFNIYISILSEINLVDIYSNEENIRSKCDVVLSCVNNITNRDTWEKLIISDLLKLFDKK